MSKIREEQDRLTVIILEELRRGACRREQLMKRVLIRCGSRSKFNRIMQYLTEHGFLKKRGRTGGRAPYTITEKGLKQLAVLKNNT